MRSAQDGHDVGSEPIGAGFFVAPRQVLTCARVIAAKTHPPPERVAGRWGDADLELEVMQFQPEYS